MSELKDVLCTFKFISLFLLLLLLGASDEGPSIHEVMFLWTERHVERQREVTMVTTRCSGDSYLNPVELVNGHLARGHSNAFIPSTLKGSPINDNGK